MLEELSFNFPILSCLLAVPLLGALVLWFLDDEEMVKAVGLGVSLLELALAIVVLVHFVPDSPAMQFVERDKTACFLTVPAPHTFHIVHADDEGNVTRLEHIGRSPVRINAGFFVLRREIFDVMRPGEELVIEPFQRLIERNQLVAVPYDGFWQNMDTFKDKVLLDEIAAGGNPPWAVGSH